MSTRTKVIIGALAVVVIVGAALIGFVKYQIIRSFPRYTGVVRIPALHSPVTIRRDDYGVPLIEAGDEHDLMIALGYAHAQDRLWQMDIQRRAGEGRLSEVFGNATIPFDRMFRILGIRVISETIEQHITRESRERLTWYAEGINAFIEAHKGDYPVEFDMLGYDPDPWRPVHSIIIGRLMAWELNLSWWTDLTLGAIAGRVGLEKALDVFPTFPSDVPPVVPVQEWKQYVGLGKGFMKTAQEFRSFQGQEGILGGSNAWVVAPRKSASGSVILANDTHLPLQSPSKFHEVHLKAPGYNVGGFSLPGIPGIIIGRNERIAWGLTNVMTDDADFYIVELDPAGESRYNYDGQWRPLTVREEEIHVRNDTSVAVRIRATHHGPIVTDIETTLKQAEHPFVASMRWTGLEISDQIDAFNKINRASNWREFTEGVREFGGPGQNFVYGDVDGNIGYWCGVKLPIRGKQSSSLPLPGWDPSVEWRGFVPFEELPHRFNPPEGYIATANNKIVDDSYPYHISDLWEPPSRIQRLYEILGQENKFTVEDFERLQNDRFSWHAREMLPYILDAISDTACVLPEKELLVEYLKNWHFMFTPEDIATSIYQEYTVQLKKNIYRDEMGDDLFHDFLILVNVPLRVTTRLVKEGTSSWFDDIHTEEVETRDDIIRRSMHQALVALQERFGPEMKKWRWGDMHTVTLEHPFGRQKPLDRLFNIGPFPYGGGSTTLVSGEYSLNKPFSVTVGASVRQIVDFSRPEQSRRVLPTGQSGQVLHPQYDDQTHLWLNGGYRTAYTAMPEGSSWKELTLEPGR